MIEFPYGIADFHRIRTRPMLYVDRTAHIRDLERLGDILVFLRPRRFGKSLWLQTLANYYDLRRRHEFEALFGDLAIGRQPTDRAGQYLVLQWNFSVVDPSGEVEKIAASLHEHVRSRAAAFASDYEDHLGSLPRIEGSPSAVLDSVLSAVRKAGHGLYLLIDEYDNFVNEVMATDVATYRALVDTDGPFKQLFKAVKNATEGQGLERVFITGVSPVALSDLTSGFNMARDVSTEPALATLCGFREAEIRQILERIEGETELTRGDAAAAVDTMRIWYNGYRFSPDSNSAPVYNPTNVLYFLEHLYRHGRPPRQLHDDNLRTDRSKLAFLARTAAGSGVVEALGENGDEITIPRLETSFSLDHLTAKLGTDRGTVASFLYYLGLLTLGDEPGVLKIPNLVVKKLFLERLLEIYLPDAAENYRAREIVMGFLRDGDLRPLLEFLENKLLAVLSNRDHGFKAREPGDGGSGVNEMTLKSLFLSLLFDDLRYVAYSELEIERSHADLCLLVRPEMRRHGLFDLLFEFKLVRRKDLGRKGRELRQMDDADLRSLPPVASALNAARDQLKSYRDGLLRRHGDSLDLRCYAVVAVGLERLIGEELS